MKKVLLVDDEEDIIEVLQYNLKAEGYEVLTAVNGSNALQQLVNKPDLIVLDIMMPVMDGFEALENIRKTKGFKSTPVIFLTAKSSEVDEVKGLNAGAVHYLIKPVSVNTFIARVNNLLRTTDTEEQNEEEGVVVIGPLQIDRSSYRVVVSGNEFVLPRKEFELLYYLAKNPTTVHSRETLLRKVWGTDVFVGDRTIDVHIRKIREKLGGYADCIETLKGVGYRFKNPI